jgi:glycosyltransferase involved in cell wall biosynthesis
VSGLKWFVDQVWPAVREHCELHVVGTVCDSLETTDPRIVRHGIVEDLQRAHIDCDIAVNPVFVGGGIKIKTLDAMSHGIPCVTTVEGARGLESAVGTGLVVARSRAEFAASILALVDDRQRRAEIAIAAQRYIVERHSPSVAFRDLLLFITHA